MGAHGCSTHTFTTHLPLASCADGMGGVMGRWLEACIDAGWQLLTPKHFARACATARMHDVFAYVLNFDLVRNARLHALAAALPADFMKGISGFRQYNFTEDAIECFKHSDISEAVRVHMAAVLALFRKADLFVDDGEFLTGVIMEEQEPDEGMQDRKPRRVARPIGPKTRADSAPSAAAQKRDDVAMMTEYAMASLNLVECPKCHNYFTAGARMSNHDNACRGRGGASAVDAGVAGAAALLRAGALAPKVNMAHLCPEGELCKRVVPPPGCFLRSREERPLVSAKAMDAIEAFRAAHAGVRITDSMMLEHLKDIRVRVGGYDVAMLASDELPTRQTLKILLSSMFKRDRAATVLLQKRGVELAAVAAAAAAAAGAAVAPVGGDGVAAAGPAVGAVDLFHAALPPLGGRARGRGRGGHGAVGVRRHRNVGDHAGAIGDVASASAAAAGGAAGGGGSDGGVGGDGGRPAKRRRVAAAADADAAAPLFRSGTLPREGAVSRSGRNTQRIVLGHR